MTVTLPGRPRRREGYAAVERRLAAEDGDDRHGDTEAKVPHVWELIRCADEWAQEVGWTPLASDASPRPAARTARENRMPGERRGCGPVDPRVGPQPVDEVDRPATFTLMAPGWWPPTGLVTQAYGWCFTPDGLVVLIATADGTWKLPGGQVEPGEHPADTLRREVAEEVCARVTASRYLACQHVWDPRAPAGPTSHYQSRWWARIELEPWQPAHETVARRAVPPGRALAALSWRRKEIAGRLLELAQAADVAVRDPHGHPWG